LNPSYYSHAELTGRSSDPTIDAFIYVNEPYRKALAYLLF